MRFPTRIAIVVRADLATWQKLNVTAFLASGLAHTTDGVMGRPSEDGSDNVYLPMFREPVMVYAAEAAGLTRSHGRALGRGLAAGVYTEELFDTGNDDDNRAAVRAFEAGEAGVGGARGVRAARRSGQGDEGPHAAPVRRCGVWSVVRASWWRGARCGAVRASWWLLRVTAPRHATPRHAVRCGAVRCGAVRCGAVRCGAVRCGAVLIGGPFTT